jgi:RNA recognition motif-containing protein
MARHVLYCQGIAEDVTDNILVEIFCGIGPVNYFLRSSFSPSPGTRIHYAFVGYSTEALMRRALETLSYAVISEAVLHCHPADPEIFRIRHSPDGAILVRNLLPAIGTGQLDETFAKFGEVVWAELFPDPDSPDGSNTAFIHFRGHENAKSAVRDLFEATLKNRRIYVAFAEAVLPSGRFPLDELVLKCVESRGCEVDVDALFEPWDGVRQWQSLIAAREQDAGEEP